MHLYIRLVAGLANCKLYVVGRANSNTSNHALICEGLVPLSSSTSWCLIFLWCVSCVCHCVRIVTRLPKPTGCWAAVEQLAVEVEPLGATFELQPCLLIFGLCPYILVLIDLLMYLCLLVFSVWLYVCVRVESHCPHYHWKSRTTPVWLIFFLCGWLISLNDSFNLINSFMHSICFQGFSAVVEPAYFSWLLVLVTLN
jgi:hypothetical protein